MALNELLLHGESTVIVKCSTIVSFQGLLPISRYFGLRYVLYIYIYIYIYTSCNPCCAQMCTGGTTSWKSHMLCGTTS